MAREAKSGEELFPVFRIAAGVGEFAELREFFVLHGGFGGGEEGGRVVGEIDAGLALERAPVGAGEDVGQFRGGRKAAVEVFADFLGGAGRAPDAELGEPAGGAAVLRVGAAEVERGERVGVGGGAGGIEFAVDEQAEDAFRVAGDGVVGPNARGGFFLGDDDIGRGVAVEPDAELGGVEIDRDLAGSAEKGVEVVEGGIEFRPALEGKRAGERELRGRKIRVGAVEAEGALGVAAEVFPEGGDRGIGGEERAEFVGSVHAEIGRGNSLGAEAGEEGGGAGGSAGETVEGGAALGNRERRQQRDEQRGSFRGTGGGERGEGFVADGGVGRGAGEAFEGGDGAEGVFAESAKGGDGGRRRIRDRGFEI